MKPHPRLRRAALVSGAVVSVLLVAAWIGSAWWELVILHPEGSDSGIAAGRLYIGRPAWHSGLESESFRWFVIHAHEPFHWRWRGLERGFSMPLWFPAGLSLLGTAAVWRLDARARRRARVGACAKCGYDRAGLPPASPCPECGTMPPAAAAAQQSPS